MSHNKTQLNKNIQESTTGKKNLSKTVEYALHSPLYYSTQNTSNIMTNSNFSFISSLVHHLRYTKKKKKLKQLEVPRYISQSPKKSKAIPSSNHSTIITLLTAEILFLSRLNKQSLGHLLLSLFFVVVFPCSSTQSGTYSADQAGLNLTKICLPLPPECQD